jgi:hypothetical protein
MRPLSKAMLLVAGVHAAAITSLPAYAQTPQPVPYNTPQVPYGQATPAPGPTTPQAPLRAGSDVIYLKGGGILRGTIVDAIPNAQARIQLATGEIATVPWQQIDKIEQSRQGPPAATTPPAPAPTQPPAPPAPPPPPSAIVPVHVDGPDGAELQQDAGKDDWKTVCQVPCDKQLPTGGHYRIMGEGIRASGDFTLHADAGQRETITVSGGSKNLHTLGIVGIVVGSTLTGLGLLTVLVGYGIQSSYNLDRSLTAGNTTTNTNDGSGTLAVGWAMTLVGLAAGIGGLVLTLNNSKTSVSQDVSGSAGATGAANPEAFKPTPTWKEASVLERAAPPILGIPVFGGSF